MQRILQGSDKETEGYQEIPYGGCERLQDPPDACYCLFISGLIPPLNLQPWPLPSNSYLALIPQTPCPKP